MSCCSSNLMANLHNETGNGGGSRRGVSGIPTKSVTVKCNLARENWQHLFSEVRLCCVLRARRGYRLWLLD